MHNGIWAHSSGSLLTALQSREQTTTYAASDVAVVQMDARVDVVAFLFGVEQKARELEAEVHIVRAAAPAPIGHGSRRACRVHPVVPHIAAARLELALAARL